MWSKPAEVFLTCFRIVKIDYMTNIDFGVNAMNHKIAQSYEVQRIVPWRVLQEASRFALTYMNEGPLLGSNEIILYALRQKD